MSIVPVVEIYYDGAWRPLASGRTALYSPGIQVERGARGEQDGVPGGTGGIQAGQASMTLLSPDGIYSLRNAASPLYGKIGINTPLRIAVQPRATTGAGADASDAFARTVSNGWGAADVGGTYSLRIPGGGSSSWFAVTPGAATHAIGSAGLHVMSYLNDLVIGDTQASVTFACPVPTGGVLEPTLAVWGTSTSSYIQARVTLATSGAVTIGLYDRAGALMAETLTGLTHVGTGTPLRMSVRTVDREVWGKVWNPAGAEPDWQVTAVETVGAPFPAGAGFVGVRSGRGSGNTNAGTQFTYSDFSVTNEIPRFVGKAPRWPVSADSTGTIVTTAITARGAAGTLGQGAEPLNPAFLLAILASTGVVAVWPMTDGSGAERVAAATPATPPMSAAGMSFGADGPAGLGGAVQIWDGTTAATATAEVPSPAGADWSAAWSVGFWLRITETAAASVALPIVIETLSGPHRNWTIGMTGSTDTISVNSSNVSGTLSPISVSISGSTNPADGAWHFYVLEVQQSGAAEVTANLYVDGSFVDSDTQSGTGYLIDRPRTIRVARTDFPGGSFVNTDGVYMSGLFVAYGSVNSGPLHTAGLGHAGEAAWSRFDRLCTEAGIQYAITSGISGARTMGPQEPKTLLELLAECGVVEGAGVYEARRFDGLILGSESALINQAPSVTYAYSSSHLASFPEIVDDDQLARNYVVADRPGGSSSTYEVTSGTLSTAAPPNGIGRVPDTPSVPAYTDSVLDSYAQWYANVRCVDVPRIPSFTVTMQRDDISSDQTITDATLALDIDAQSVRLNGMPAWSGEESIDVLVTGLTEKIDQFDHTITFSGVPAKAWNNVAVWDASTSRYDSEYSTTAASFLSGTDTSLSVAIEAGRALWVTGSGSPQFPFDIKVGGVILTVTAISGTSSPQTFTVDATPVNGVSRTIAAGAPVRLANPVRYGR